MSFSFLGYIHIEPISLTFVYIPVLMAGCMLGPKQAAAAGAWFVFAATLKVSAIYLAVGFAVFFPPMRKCRLYSLLFTAVTVP